MNKLVLCYVGASQQSTPPMAVVGRVKEETEDRIVIEGPMSSDVAYFTLVGKRLRPLVDRREMERAREEKSMRALPQLSPSDFVMMGVNNAADYMKSTMTFYHSQLVYTAELSEDSPFGIAYGLMEEALTSEDSALTSFFIESLFEFDVKHYLSGLMNPDKIQDILVPPVVNAQEKG